MTDVDEIEEVFALFRLTDEQLEDVGASREELVEEYRKYHAALTAHRALKLAELSDIDELRSLSEDDGSPSSVTLVPTVDKAVERENRIKRKMSKLRLLSKLVDTVQALEAERDLCEYLANQFEEFAFVWTNVDAKMYQMEIDIKRKFGEVIDKFDRLFRGDEVRQTRTIYILEKAVSEFITRRNLILEQIETKLNNEFFNY